MCTSFTKRNSTTLSFGRSKEKPSSSILSIVSRKRSYWRPVQDASPNADGTHPQHVATTHNDAIAFAYCFGYIRAQLQILAEQYPNRIELH